MNYMEIEESAFEIEVRVYHTLAKALYVKHFHMRGTNNTVRSVIEFCYEVIDKYDIDEIRILGVGGYAYDAMKWHTARRSRPVVVNRYSVTKLQLNW